MTPTQPAKSVAAVLRDARELVAQGEDAAHALAEVAPKHFGGAQYLNRAAHRNISHVTDRAEVLACFDAAIARAEAEGAQMIPYRREVAA